MKTSLSQKRITPWKENQYYDWHGSVIYIKKNVIHIVATDLEYITDIIMPEDLKPISRQELLLYADRKYKSDEFAELFK
jgi:hypothetical protein